MRGPCASPRGAAGIATSRKRQRLGAGRLGIWEGLGGSVAGGSSQEPPKRGPLRTQPVTCGRGRRAGECVRRRQPPRLVPRRFPVTVRAPEPRPSPRPRPHAPGHAEPADCGARAGAGGPGAEPGRATSAHWPERRGRGSGAGLAEEGGAGAGGWTRRSRAAGQVGAARPDHWRRSPGGRGRGCRHRELGLRPLWGGTRSFALRGKGGRSPAGEGRREEPSPQKVLLLWGKRRRAGRRRRLRLTWSAEPWGGVQGLLPHARGAERPAPPPAAGVSWQEGSRGSSRAELQSCGLGRRPRPSRQRLCPHPGDPLWAGEGSVGDQGGLASLGRAPTHTPTVTQKDPSLRGAAP